MNEWSGRLSGKVVWNGIIEVCGDVVVPEGASLRIEAGTRVRFAARPGWSCSVFRAAPEGYPIEASEREACDLVILGRLEAAGTSNTPIFMGDGDVPWGGILFLQSASGVLRHCIIKVKTEYALQTFDDSRLALESCNVEEAQVGIVSRGLSRVKVLGGCVRAARCGAVACEGSRVVLDNLQIQDSPQGVCAEDWALVRAKGSRFASNRDFAVSAQGHSWARLEGCGFERSGERTLVREQARIDVH
ncbi:MAG: hypothetical protein KGL04_02840 [Elusimicrobia bacterium]|nr:hypothetical protein [Elusimicrobiota bacterium]